MGLSTAATAGVRSEFNASYCQAKGRGTFNPQEVTEQERSNRRTLPQVFEAVINLRERRESFKGANFGVLKHFRRANRAEMVHAREKAVSRERAGV